MRRSRPKEAEALRRDYDTRHQRVIKAFDLTRAEAARLHTMDVNDPLSGYVGNIVVHADLIVEDRTAVPDNIILGEE